MAKFIAGWIIADVLLMLIDTRDGPPDGDDRHGRSWLFTVLDWVMPWPALIVWLVAAAIATPGLLGALCAVSAMLIGAWRLALAGGNVGGMRDWKQ